VTTFDLTGLHPLHLPTDFCPVLSSTAERVVQNGRLAMCAVMGMMVQETVTGQTLVNQISAGNINPFHL
jgi:hypothetical protein